MDLTNYFENDYIDNLIKHQEFASLYLKNGTRLKGYLTGHDETYVYLKDAYTQKIFKHRVSSIVPEMSF